MLADLLCVLWNDFQYLMTHFFNRISQTFIESLLCALHSCQGVFKQATIIFLWYFSIIYEPLKIVNSLEKGQGEWIGECQNKWCFFSAYYSSGTCIIPWRWHSSAFLYQAAFHLAYILNFLLEPSVFDLERHEKEWG